MSTIISLTFDLFLLIRIRMWILDHFSSLCRAMLCKCEYAVMQFLSVCPSVTFAYSVETNKDVLTFFTMG